MTALVQEGTSEEQTRCLYLDNNSVRDIAISGRGRNATAKARATSLLTLEDAGEVRGESAFAQQRRRPPVEAPRAAQT